jgi:hypothetical protein
MPRAAVLATATTLVALLAAGLVAQNRDAAREALIARGKLLELKTPYVAPPGEKIEHYASGYAKIMCTAVFVTGLDPAFAAENVGYFTAPYAVRKSLGTPKIDRQKQTVEVTMPNGTVRLAKHLGSQGCVTVPIGKTDVFFTPSVVTPRVPDPKTTAWPMGDVLPSGPPPIGVDLAKVRQAIDAAFDPDGMTAAFVVTYKGRIIGERYGPNITATTPLESWSMGKSLSGTLLGILIKQGAYTLDQPAPIPEWQAPGDPRQQIRIRDILNMSSGLRAIAPQDPDYDETGPYPDHFYYYTGSIDAFKYAATRPQQWQPAAVGRYRNTDPVLANYLVRMAVEKRGARHRSVRQLPHAWLRVGVGPRLGSHCEPLPAGRSLERRARPSRGLREIRRHARASVGRRQAAAIRRRPLLGQRREYVSRSERDVLYDRRRRSVRAHLPVASAGRRSAWPLQRRGTGRSGTSARDDHPVGSGPSRLTWATVR